MFFVIFVVDWYYMFKMFKNFMETPWIPFVQKFFLRDNEIYVREHEERFLKKVHP